MLFHFKNYNVIFFFPQHYSLLCLLLSERHYFIFGYLLMLYTAIEYCCPFLPTLQALCDLLRKELFSDPCLDWLFLWRPGWSEFKSMHAILVFKVIILKFASIKCKTVQCLACSSVAATFCISRPADCLSECSFQLQLQLHHVIIRDRTKFMGTHLCWNEDCPVAS